MMYKTPEVIKCNMAGSECTSLSGAHIEDVKTRVKEEDADMKEELLIIQEGGNYLVATGQRN